ncbi:long-chain-fatty-acid--CoA ligase [Paenibacillus sp. J31TS4]|uniref:class I adenylate-forming enzyme family protein n=1 Tax=Paenibacillus sp. J31TS4 TaxID=2807195 RepID=UPI001B179D30|nr:class I adenylate-forming enzyme family protein [Paenibacillus sp. J31TS4]GIP41257.1 long-chain-fatty-acid--CoA ligase [Paenibacillus sp. J31TS4]
MKPLTNNFGDLTHRAVRLLPDKPAVVAPEATLTYRELEERMNVAGGVFRRLGIEFGDRVALLFPNDYRFVELCFGLMRIGAVPLPLNRKLNAETLSYILADSGAKLLVAHESLLAAARELSWPTRSGPLLVVGKSQGASESKPEGNPFPGGPDPDEVPYEALAAGQEPIAESVTVRDDDLCFLLYTSGSTGRPKGCMLTHGGQWWNAETNRRVLLLEESDVALVSVPLYHKNAMINAVKPCLLLGATLVILPGFDPAEVIAAVETYRVTYTTGVPAMYKMILAHHKQHPGRDLSSLRFLICGSSEVPPELMRELQERYGVDVLEAYGLTEGGPQVLVSPRWGIRRQGAAGLPLPGCDVKVVSTDGAERELGPGEIGELWVRNPGVAIGYWNLPEVTKARFTEDGWLKTGDLARFDEDGYGYIAGRKDDLIIIGGENAYPKEIEDVLIRHPEIDDVCVVAMAHPTKGKAPAAFVVRRPGSSLSEKELQAYFLERGPAYAHPRRVVFLESMPLSGTGKIDKASLSARLEEKG